MHSNLGIRGRVRLRATILTRVHACGRGATLQAGQPLAAAETRTSFSVRPTCERANARPNQSVEPLRLAQEEESRGTRAQLTLHNEDVGRFCN